MLTYETEFVFIVCKARIIEDLLSFVLIIEP